MLSALAAAVTLFGMSRSPESTTNGWTAGPVISLIAGCLFALMAFGVLAGAVAIYTIHSNQREDGFVTSPVGDFDTRAYAVVTEGFEIAEGPDWVLPETILGDARVRITGADKPIFVGIAPTADVDGYLKGVSYAEIPDLSQESGRNLPPKAGGPPSATPASQEFWVASGEGPAPQTVRWPISNGSWSVVIMNSDASEGVAFEGDVGAEATVLRPIYVALFVAGGVLLVAAIVLIVVAVKRAGRTSGWTSFTP